MPAARMTNAGAVLKLERRRYCPQGAAQAQKPILRSRSCGSPLRQHVAQPVRFRPWCHFRPFPSNLCNLAVPLHVQPLLLRRDFILRLRSKLQRHVLAFLINTSLQRGDRQPPRPSTASAVSLSRPPLLVHQLSTLSHQHFRPAPTLPPVFRANPRPARTRCLHPAPRCLPHATRGHFS